MRVNTVEQGTNINDLEYIYNRGMLKFGSLANTLHITISKPTLT